MPEKKKTPVKKPVAKKAVKVTKPAKMQHGNGFGITGLVFGILSLIFLWLLPPLSFILSIFGIVFSAVQQKRTPTGLSIAGLITNIIGFILSLIFTAILVGLVFAARELFTSGISNLKETLGSSPFDQFQNLQELKELLSQLPKNVTY